jgi:hypothetical protein
VPDIVGARFAVGVVGAPPVVPPSVGVVGPSAFASRGSSSKQPASEISRTATARREPSLAVAKWAPHLVNPVFILDSRKQASCASRELFNRHEVAQKSANGRRGFLATPLSCSSRPRTGGFASPPHDGFAFNLSRVWLNARPIPFPLVRIANDVSKEARFAAGVPAIASTNLTTQSPQTPTVSISD